MVVNGKYENTSEISLLEYLQQKKYNPKHIVIELNEKILSNKEYDNITLKENDVLEILMFMGGGQV